jgi:hypothetical protein
MSKYASLLFKPEEYREVGPFRFPIYHDLVPGEAKGIEAIARQQSKHTFRSIKLAQRIAKDKEITVKEAVELLSGSEDGDSQELLLNYAAELEEMQANSLGANEQQIAYVTLFMQYRAEAKLPGATEWAQLRDWSQDDTEGMPSALMAEIFTLIMWERDGWPEPGAAGKDPEASSTTPTSSDSSTTPSSTSGPRRRTGTRPTSASEPQPSEPISPPIDSSEPPSD